MEKESIPERICLRMTLWHRAWGLDEVELKGVRQTERKSLEWITHLTYEPLSTLRLTALNTSCAEMRKESIRISLMAYEPRPEPHSWPTSRRPVAHSSYRALGLSPLMVYETHNMMRIAKAQATRLGVGAEQEEWWWRLGPHRPYASSRLWKSPRGGNRRNLKFIT
jgi:hypothetical protein